MQDFSIADLPNELPRFLELVASGEQVRLCEGENEFAVVTPATKQPESEQSFAEWVAEWREKCDIDTYGLTDEEIEAMRDRSPGPEPPSFD